MAACPGPGPETDAAEVGQGTGLSVGRLEAFSDGVLAVVLTLLILHIKVPSSKDDRGHLAHALGQMWPTYLAYLAIGTVVLDDGTSHLGFLVEPAAGEGRSASPRRADGARTSPVLSGSS
jgi:hypothetical protein